jgi:hypothetical protein
MAGKFRVSFAVVEKILERQSPLESGKQILSRYSVTLRKKEVVRASEYQPECLTSLIEQDGHEFV